MFKINKINPNKVILFLILILAGILRFYKLNEVPFTYDEYSALFRTQYNSLKDLINFGVAGDGHPAGIQFLLYYLVKLFGFNEFWIKFLFVLFGIFSVLYTYKIGKIWFNESVGILSATFIACLQFNVMYSQIARPYISGLFFSLFMIYNWSQYLFYSNKKIDKYLAGFILGAILCAYNHYFSLLLVIITGFTGLFFIKKEKIIHYLSSGLIIFLFFIPHLNLLFLAMKIKGLSWLDKPDIFFFSDYIRYIFNSSIIIGILIITILIWSLLKRDKDSEKNKFRVISIILFILPLIIGYSYSILIKPVIQFSVLIFSFPFLIILLVSWIKELPSHKNLMFTVLIATITCFSLIFEKKHYKIFYQSGFVEILKDDTKWLKKYNPENVTSILSSNNNIIKHLLKKDTALFNNTIKISLIDKLNKQKDNLFIFGFHNTDSIACFNENTSIEEYKNFLDSQTTDYLYFGWAHHLDPKILNIIPNYYPYKIYTKYLYNSETYLFSKTKPETKKTSRTLFETYNNFEKESPLWSTCKNISDSVSYKGDYVCFISENSEFSPTFQSKFNSVFNNNSEYLYASVKFYSPKNTCNAFLVFSIESKNRNIKWYKVNLNDFIDNKQKWQTANLKVQLNKIHIPFNKTVKVYIWNLNHEKFFIDDFSIKIYPGNKNRYSY